MSKGPNLYKGNFQSQVEESTDDDGTKQIQLNGQLWQQEMRQVCEFLSKKDTNPFTNRSIVIGSKTFWKVVKLCEERSLPYQDQVRKTIGDLETQLSSLEKNEIKKRKAAYLSLFQPDKQDKKLSVTERKRKYANVFAHFGEQINHIDRNLDGFIPLLPADELVIRYEIQQTILRLQQHIDLIEPFFDDLCRTIFTAKKYSLDYSTFKADWNSKEEPTVKIKKVELPKSNKEIHAPWRTEQKLYYFALKIIQYWAQKLKVAFPPPTFGNQVENDFEQRLSHALASTSDVLKFICPDGSFLLISAFEVTKPMIEQLKKDFQLFSERYLKAFGDTARIEGSSVCKWKGSKSNKGLLQILLADDPHLLTLLLQYNQILQIIKNISQLAKGKGNVKRLSQVFDEINLQLKTFASFFDAMFKRLINDTKYLDLKNKWPLVFPPSSKQITDSLSPDRDVIAYSKIVD